MVWSDQFKLEKRLISSLIEAGYVTANELQSKLISRVLGGQDVIGIGSEAAGKTTTMVVCIMAKIKDRGDEDAPRALVLVPDENRIAATMAIFNTLNTKLNLRIVGLSAANSLAEETDLLTDGVDIVLATPSRARAIYLKLGLNLNKLQILAIDDADIIVHKGLTLPVCELARSAGKTQYIAFSRTFDRKVAYMTDQFMSFPVHIEAEDSMHTVKTHQLLAYRLPETVGKLEFLQLLEKDGIFAQKTVIFVNERLTAQRLGKALTTSTAQEVSVFKPLFFNEDGFDDFDDFKTDDRARILIMANEIFSPAYENLDLTGIFGVVYYEFPIRIEQFVNQMVKSTDSDLMVFAFAKGDEFLMLEEIEERMGIQVQKMELPEAFRQNSKASNRKRSLR